MHVAKWNEADAKGVAEPGAEGVTIRVLMGDNVGAPNFAMRRFELAPGGRTPYHAHAWEHEVYVLSGRGKVRRAGGGESEIEGGSFVFVAPDEEHNFVNVGDAPFVFLCVVPVSKPCVK
jgi:quercetin dioxygenase-like cupin family protein